MIRSANCVRCLWLLCAGSDQVPQVCQVGPGGGGEPGAGAARLMEPHGRGRRPRAAHPHLRPSRRPPLRCQQAPTG